MAKVSLRIYNREIESLIDQGRLDEAVAHCQHILKTFPKHLETYRLLGKAFLEAKRYDEAVDIFNRVLMAVPDDFVAHVGMSIIRDEQNKLDDAIWHMERAFEAQPSNAAIQSELQRLYGRRDGMEPPKIRMTRGALAHMYVQGELYPQAISEIRAVLASDAQRADMQVLLARAFFRGGQKADASDMCAQLLKRYPYCFDANRIMVELLPASDKAENTQVYRLRVNELDPYSTFAKESVFNSAEVPDASVNLDRLDYKGQEVGMGRDWGTSLGIGLSTPASAPEQPEWLRSGLSEESAQPEAASAPGLEPASASTSNADIPDFLRDAGWTESSSAGEEPSTAEASSDQEALTPANIPDWLKDQMPPEPPAAAPAAGVGERPTVPPTEAPDWLSGLGETTESGVEPASTPTDLPDWLSGLGEEQPAQGPATPASGDMPDWLSGLGAEKPAQEPAAPVSADVTDWLSSLDNDQPSEAAAPASSEESDWLSGAGASTPAASEPVAADLPDWLKGLDAAGPEEPSKVEEPAMKAEELTPDWLAPAPATTEEETEPVQPAPPPASIESLGASSKEQDDAIAWLEMLAAKHGAKPEELVTDPAARSEKPPEWVEQARALAEAKPAEIPAEQPQAEEKPSLDATGVWLRDLAAEQPANTVAPEETPAVEAELPDWLKSIDTEPAQPAQDVQPEQPVSAAEEQPPAQETVEPEIPVARKTLPQTRPLDEEALTQLANVPDWLIGMKDEDAEETGSQKDVAAWLSGLDKEEAKPEGPVVEPPAEETPAWLSGLEKAEEIPVQPAGTVSGETEIPEWLSGLEEEETLAAESETPSTSDVPEWLSDLESAEITVVHEEVETPAEEALPAETEPPAPVEAAAADLPEWLRGLDEVPAEPAEQPVMAQENIPSWLKADFEEEEPHPEPVAASDWHPEEAAEPPAAEPQPEPEIEAPAARIAPSLAEPPIQPPPPDVRKPAPPRVPEPGKPARVRQVETTQSTAVALSQAQTALSRGDIPGSLSNYNKLIRKGKHLEEAIRDLRESLYRYPVEVGIWQTLGDAYMRSNRLQEALDAYNKAEELLR